jgi:hypothetical protein
MEKTGLETRLKEILESHASTVERYKSERDELRNRAMFCREHNFEEERRITLIKLEQTGMLFYEYESMFNDVNEAINLWNS